MTIIAELPKRREPTFGQAASEMRVVTDALLKRVIVGGYDPGPCFPPSAPYNRASSGAAAIGKPLGQCDSKSSDD